jgi:DNA-directed RNA polymerase specialized sigma24 family protein
MVESDFNKKLKTLSQIALKVIIKGTSLKTKSELLLWKFYIEDKTYSEIVDDLGIEISSVGKALWNAKKELKEIINNERHLIPQEIHHILSSCCKNNSKGINRQALYIF